MLLLLPLFVSAIRAELCSRDYLRLQEPIGNVDQYQQVEVRTSRGDVRGFELVNHSGRRGNVFLGIPFAEPPVGPLRFAHPVQKKPWQDPIDAFDYKNDCMQPTFFVPGSHANSSTNNDEDCLYLNIVTPVRNPGSTETFAVIVYIFGGVFNFGTPSVIKPRFAVEDLASEGVILVVPNYRMNIFGYWSTGNDVAPGNNQIFDIKMALQWIQDEINHFGGDPTRVTLEGHSSGGANVQYLTLSPLTEGLFHQAIVNSGQGMAQTFVSDDLSRYKESARRLDCNDNDQWSKKEFQAIKECMQRVDAGRAVFEYMRLIDLTDPFAMNSYARVDGRGGILPEHQSELLKKRRPINYLIGTTNNEKSDFRRTDPQPTRQQIKKSCMLAAKTYGNVNFTSLCTDFYDIEIRSSGIKDFVNQPLKQIDSDHFYHSTVFTDAASMRDVSGTVYLYSFDYIKPGFEQKMALHAGDLFYLLGQEEHFYVSTSCATDDDDQLRKRYTRAFANFAKTGNPTPPGVEDPVIEKWEPLRSPTGFNYMSIDKNWTMKEFFHFNAIRLWNEIFPHFNATL